VISRWGGNRSLTSAFTEHGVAMLKSFLPSISFSAMGENPYNFGIRFQNCKDFMIYKTAPAGEVEAQELIFILRSQIVTSR
jgi:hypothetical protein